MVEEDEDAPVTMADEGEYQDDAELRQAAIHMKELKFAAMRNSAPLHKKLNFMRKFVRANAVYWFVGVKTQPMSQVLPWLCVGNRDLSSKLGYLMSKGFTHVLNVTKEVCVSSYMYISLLLHVCSYT
jgi:hypothetical protein